MNKLFIVLIAIMLASSFAMKIKTTGDGKNQAFKAYLFFLDYN